MRSICLFLLLSLCLTGNLAADGDAGKRDRALWEKIFSIISEEIKSDPYIWFKNQMGVVPLSRKGNRITLGHNYTLFIEKTTPKKPLVYLEGDRDEKRTLLQSQQVYIIGDTGIVKRIIDGYFVLVYNSDYIFLINIEDNSISRVGIGV